MTLCRVPLGSEPDIFEGAVEGLAAVARSTASRTGDGAWFFSGAR